MSEIASGAAPDGLRPTTSEEPLVRGRLAQLAAILAAALSRCVSLSRRSSLSDAANSSQKRPSFEVCRGWGRPTYRCLTLGVCRTSGICLAWPARLDGLVELAGVPWLRGGSRIFPREGRLVQRGGIFRVSGRRGQTWAPNKLSVYEYVISRSFYSRDLRWHFKRSPILYLLRRRLNDLPYLCDTVLIFFFLMISDT